MKKVLIIFILISVFGFLGVFDFTQAQTNLNYNYSNPIGYDSITAFAEGILTSIQGLVGWLAILFIVIGGVIYITSSGKENQITLAKNTIIYALVGFAIAVAGPSLLKEIQDLVLGSGTPTSISNAKSIENILDDILNFVLTLIGILSLMSLIYSGFVYLFSGGDKNKTEQAKKIALYSVIAMSIAGGSLIIIQTVITFLSV